VRRVLQGDAGRTLAAVLAVASLAAVLQAARAWDVLDALIFDAFTVALARQPAAPSPVIVVGIDEPSFAELGRRWPWPREMHARLVDELTAAGASVVAFDVVFAEPSSAPDDIALGQAVRPPRRVVLAGALEIEDSANFRGVRRLEPLPALREAGASVGLASIEVDPDQVVRRFPRDREALWRVVRDRYLEARPGERSPADVPDGALLRYSDGSDVGFVSYYQAIDARRLLPPETFRGRIALVGLALKTTPDPTQRAADNFATPFLRFSRLFAPGVEIHAQFVAAALAGRVLAPVGLAWTVFLGALALATTAASMARWRATRNIVLVVALVAALLGLALLLFARGGAWLRVALPVGMAIGMYVARGSTAYLDERARRRRIRRAFEFYVAPAVVAEVTSHPERLALGGERRELTVMFTDLAGFTAMSEDMPPERVARLLNEHLTRMTAIVLRHRGTIDKFIGDAVMAFWGAPIADRDHALHAVRAAVEMQAEMGRWRAEPGGPAQLHMRVGLNAGPMVVGNLGSRDRFDYTVIGDAVNLASRLESVNRVYGTSILLSDAVARHMGEAIGLRPVDRVRVKGKREAIEIHTPCDDVPLVSATREAIAAYRARQWDVAEGLWLAMARLAPRDGLAQVYLARIAAHRGSPPAAGWDGTFDLQDK
jgi:adenylate cyclase